MRCGHRAEPGHHGEPRKRRAATQRTNTLGPTRLLEGHKNLSGKQGLSRAGRYNRRSLQDMLPRQIYLELAALLAVPAAILRALIRAKVACCSREASGDVITEGDLTHLVRKAVGREARGGQRDADITARGRRKWVALSMLNHKLKAAHVVRRAL